MSTPELPRRVRGFFQSPSGARSPFFTLEVAATPEQQSKGLSGRASLAKNHGMLFAFDKFDFHSFWMKNTYVALDIAWLDAEGQVLQKKVMKPLDLQQHRPERQAKYAVELEAGTLLAVQPGDRLVVTEKMR